MKKIGFVDYYLSEWHANNYPAWIAEACARLGLDYQIAYAWGETEISPVDGRSGAEWCEAFGVQKCETLAELCEKSDVIVVLAPSNPETHLRYAEEVLKYGKRTYIDKTFAPDLATAKKIFELSEQYGTPFFSSSALRYATELDGYENCRQFFVAGSGATIEEYIIHMIEMAVKKLGMGAEAILAERFGAQTFLHVKYNDDRVANMIFARSLPYTVYMSDGEPKGTRPVTATVQSKFFDGLIEDILNFFETGKISFDVQETLEVMKLREGAVLAEQKLGEWIDLRKLG